MEKKQSVSYLKLFTNMPENASPVYKGIIISLNYYG